ncbi:hypothetical protein B7494_g4188 [Chlorociboria aeruginascens]|nr:hypothetical protein B7494_g4188 [Chlorociboria aeruginascens]
MIISHSPSIHLIWQFIFKVKQYTKVTSALSAKSHPSNSTHLDLNRHALRQLINGDTTPRGFMHAKPLLILSIHLGEAIHRRQEDARLDDFLQTAARGAQHRAQVLQAQPRALRYASVRQTENGAAGRAGDLS